MARYDWEYWRHRYVAGDDQATLEFLSKQPNAPSLHRLKIKSSEASWADQRKTFRNQAATIATQSATAQEAVRQTAQLVDAAEVITRHLQLSKAIQSVATKALRDLDAAELSPRDILSWISSGTQIERLAMGMATERVEVDATVDFSNLSDEQLQKIANGEDPAKVVKS